MGKVEGYTCFTQAAYPAEVEMVVTKAKVECLCVKEVFREVVQLMIALLI